MPESSPHGRRLTLAAVLAVTLSVQPALAGSGDDDEARAVGTPEALVASPAELALTGRRDARQLLVSGHDHEGPKRDLTHLVSIAADDPAVVEVGPRGYVTPKATAGRCS